MEGCDLDFTYVNYKVATGRLIAWLLDTASRCGVELPDDRFKGEGDTRHLKSVKDYGTLAGVLAGHAESGVRLLPTLAVVARQAIQLRELQAKKFSHEKGHRASNRTHRHFIEQLKFVLQILETTTVDIDLGRLSSSTLCSSDIIPAVWPQRTRQHPSAPTPVLDDELSGSDFDKAIAICTFFEDMAAIRDDLHDTWKDYATGDLCLTAAAVTTDTAFTIMMASCEEIIQLLPDAPSWLALAMRFKEVTDRQNVQESDFLNLTCSKVAFRLNELCLNLRPNHLLVKKPGCYVDHHPAKDRSTWSIEDQDEEDAVILSELFMDVVVLSRTKLSVPAQDNLTAGLRTTVNGGSFDSMPIYVVFAAQIFLDIHHLLRDGITRSFDSLQTAGKRACDILDEHSRSSNGTSPQCESTQALTDMKAYVKEWMENDIVGTALRHYGGGQAAVRPFRFLRNHPILCGLKVFRLQILLQCRGIEMGNDSGSIVAAAHIYNAAYQSGGLQQPWKDIDYIIDLHTPKRVFSGRPPSVVAEYFDRFLLVLSETQGMMYERLHLDSRMDSVRVNNKRIKLKVTSPVRDVFENRYVLGGEARMTLDYVAMCKIAARRVRTSALSEETVEFLREMAAKRRYTTTELIYIVREGVAAEELYLLFDYIGLHDRVVNYLGEVYHTFHAGLDLSFGPTAVLDISNLMLIVARLFDTVKELDRSATDPGRSLSENILSCLAHTVNKFVGDNDGLYRGSASIGPARVLTNASMVAQWKVASLE